MSADDWLKVIWALTVLLSVTAPAFYLTVVRPFLAQIKELIVELRANTAATNTSATALATTADAVTANTVATKAVVDAIPSAPVTVNVAPAGESTP